MSMDKVCCIDTTLRESNYVKKMKKTLHIKPLFPVPKQPAETVNNFPPDHKHDWMRLALILDRIFFLIYTIVLIIFFILYFPRPDMDNLNILTRRHFD